jgi:peptide/nickel transport system ATP-binding protein
MYAGRVLESGPTQSVISLPQHPYTRGLMAAIPKIGSISNRLTQIDGAMLPPGSRGEFCGFNPRCPSVMPICRARRPLPISSGDRDVACWLETSGGERDVA